MPNWCDNQITITGDKSVIDKIEKIVKEEDKSDIGFLQFMYPCPEECLSDGFSYVLLIFSRRNVPSR